MLPSYQPYVSQSISSTACLSIRYVNNEIPQENYVDIRPKDNGPIDDWLFKYKIDTKGMGLYIQSNKSSKPLNLTAHVSVEETPIEKCFTYSIPAGSHKAYCIGHIFENEELPKHDIKLRCHAKFQFVEPQVTAAQPLAHGIYDLVGECQNKNTDAEIHVDNEVIQIHRGFFSMLSPVFYAMFNHDTEEKRTGIVIIKDLDVATVQNAVNFCYGQPLKDLSTVSMMNVLTFGDKYDIQLITKKLTEWILEALNPFNFCTILNYAWATSNEAFKTKCANYYKTNVASIALTPEFAELDKEVQRDLIHRCL